MRTAKEIVLDWVSFFNAGDASKLAQFYSEDAINHQVAQQPIIGRDNIQKMFEGEFTHADMVCIVENIFEDGEWAILEWSDPLGLRGCGFFHIVNEKIQMQRGYWDKLSFLRAHKMPLPSE